MNNYNFHTQKKSASSRETKSRQQRKWTAEERRIIYETYNGRSNCDELAQRFNVGHRVIITMASRMRQQRAQGDPEPWKVKRDRKK